MRVVIGKVVDGKVVVEGSLLEEGADVTILIRDAEESFSLGPEDEAALRDAIAEGDRGDVVDTKEVIDRLKRR